MTRKVATHVERMDSHVLFQMLQAKGPKRMHHLNVKLTSPEDVAIWDMLWARRNFGSKSRLLKECIRAYALAELTTSSGRT